MGRFINCKLRIANCELKRLRRASLVALFACVTPALADNEQLLNAPDWPAYKWFASTDKKGENVDYLLLKPGETRKIPLAAGRLERLWCTAIEPEKISLVLHNGRYGSYDVLKHGEALSLLQAQVHQKAFFYLPASFDLRGIPVIRNCPPWTPLTSDSYLQVTNNSKKPEGNKFFYQVTIRPEAKRGAVPPGAPLNRTTSVNLMPGGSQTLNLSGALAGSGVVQKLVLTRFGDGNLEKLHISAKFDGDAQNAIDAPLMALLGVFEDGKEVKSAGFDYDGKSAVLKWPMPFGKGATITFKNEGTELLALDAKITGMTLKNALPYRFHAVYGAARTEQKKPVRMLEVTGQGAFCGLNLSMAPAPESPRRAFAYLEGNELITADGTKFEGTGTEDFFTSAWYFPKEPFSFPYHGMTFKKDLPPSVNAYRLMIPDAVPFKKSLTFDLEHGRRNNSNDLIYRWVAFWYAEPATKFTVPSSLGESGTQSAPGGGAAPQPLTYPQIIITALITALIVGGGGGLMVRRAREKAQQKGSR